MEEEEEVLLCVRKVCYPELAWASHPHLFCHQARARLRRLQDKFSGFGSLAHLLLHMLLRAPLTVPDAFCCCCSDRRRILPRWFSAPFRRRKKRRKKKKKKQEEKEDKENKQIQ